LTVKSTLPQSVEQQDVRLHPTREKVYNGGANRFSYGKEEYSAPFKATCGTLPMRTSRIGPPPSAVKIAA
jgi:hypothetical protein